MVIRNLQPKYGDHMKFQTIEYFTKHYKVGLLIEEELQAKMNNDSKNNSFRRSNNSSSTSKSNDFNTVSTDKIRGYQGPQRTFTPLGMRKGVTRLHGKGVLQPICPIPDHPSKKRSSKWNPNAYC